MPNPLLPTSRRQICAATFAALAAAIPVVLVFIAVWNAFSVSGDMQDVGWSSTVAWRNGPELWGPPSFAYSFFNVHISLIFWLTNLVSYLLPLSKVDFYALLCGAPYALYAAGVYTLWLAPEKPKSKSPFCRRPAEALGVALAATFGAIGMQALRLPHIEMAIPALGVWFFIALSRQKYRSAAIWLLLCLTVREDAGLHLFGILFLWGAALRVARVKSPLVPYIWRFAGAALAASLLLLFIKSTFFDGFDSLKIVYAGDPAWSHITPQFLAQRLKFFFENRSWIYIPFVLTLGWAFYARNPLIPLGYVAAVPWLLLNLIAVSPTAGALNIYYPFPFWLAQAWPLLALKLWPAKRQKTAPVRWPYLLLLLAACVGFQDGRPVLYAADKNMFDSHPFHIGPEWRQEDAIKSFVDYVAAHKTDFAHAAFDKPVLTLVIDVNDRIPWFGDWNGISPHELPEIMVYFGGAYEWVAWVQPTLVAYPKTYGYFYEVPHTMIRVAAQKPLERLLPRPFPFVPVAKPDFGTK